MFMGPGVLLWALFVAPPHRKRPRPERRVIRLTSLVASADYCVPPRRKFHLPFPARVPNHGWRRAANTPWAGSSFAPEKGAAIQTTRRGGENARNASNRPVCRRFGCPSAGYPGRRGSRFCRQGRGLETASRSHAVDSLIRLGCRSRRKSLRDSFVRWIGTL